MVSKKSNDPGYADHSVLMKSILNEIDAAVSSCVHNSAEAEHMTLSYFEAFNAIRDALARGKNERGFIWET